MAKVLTFSTQFPPWHPRGKDATNFVEKLMASFESCVPGWKKPNSFTGYNWFEFTNAVPKHHTIRHGHRFKPGNMFSPRVWSGRPYKSKQIIISQDIQVVKTWNFQMAPKLWADECVFKLNGKTINNKDFFSKLAANDGFEHPVDFMYWLAGPGMAVSNRKQFDGQIICWNPNLNYEI